jgi:predicted transcriptional regulator
MAKSEKTSPLSEAQLEIMNVVWDNREVTVAQVWRELSERRSVARNTVQTMITRLEDRGWLKHRREGITFWYTATSSRKVTLRRMLRRMTDTAFGGSTAGMVMALLEDQSLSADEAEHIQGMIEDVQRSKKQNKRRGKKK